MQKAEENKEAYYKYYYDIPYEGAVSQGKPLRKLQNITCPYRGIKIIPQSEVKHFEKQLKKCINAELSIELLSKYEKHFLPVEKALFSIFKEFAYLNPEGSFQSCLQMMYAKCLIKLKLEEFAVLDEADMLSRRLSAAAALKLRAETTKCRQLIINDSKSAVFKRKTFLAMLGRIVPNENEYAIFSRIKNKALFLPSSSSSINAFAVKYSKRSHEEITRRIFTASSGSIEHITPASIGGPNSIGNFMLVCAEGNRCRENMRLLDYIKRFPKIPLYCQLYINDIIEEIHKGGLKGNETYPYKIKERLMKESEGAVMLSLSRYKYSKEDAALAAQEYEERYKKFQKL